MNTAGHNGDSTSTRQSMPSRRGIGLTRIEALPGERLDGQTQRSGEREWPAQSRSVLTRTLSGRPTGRVSFRIGVLGAAILLIAMIIWQGITTHGAPDPTRVNTSPTVAFM